MSAEAADIATEHGLRLAFVGEGNLDTVVSVS